MSEIEVLLQDALREVTAELEDPDFDKVSDDKNIVDSVDSFLIVDLLLETEMRLEAQLGRYVTLADETIFDAEKSPLIKWQDWKAYVEKRCAE